MRQSMLVLALVATAAAPLHAQTVPVAPQPDGDAGPVAMGGFAGARVRIDPLTPNRISSVTLRK